MNIVVVEFLWVSSSSPWISSLRIPLMAYEPAQNVRSAMSMTVKVLSMYQYLLFHFVYWKLFQIISKQTNINAIELHALGKITITYNNSSLTIIKVKNWEWEYFCDLSIQKVVVHFWNVIDMLHFKSRLRIFYMKKKTC